MGASTNKVFLPLRGEPVLSWAVRAFEQCEAIAQVVVVAHADEIAAVSGILETAAFSKVGAVVPGGAEGPDGVRQALAVRGAADWLGAVAERVRRSGS